MPKISVIMPVYNAESYIKESINCILQQTFKDFELILIDDCGDDGSREIINAIKDTRVRILRNAENKGIAFSRNEGIKAATGEYIALMDDDDLTPLSRLEIENEFLDINKKIDVVGGRYQIIDGKNKSLKIFPEPLNNPEYIRAYLMFYNPMANGTAMIRKKFVEENKIKYQEKCLGMEDYRFWIDCSLKGRITNLPDILLSWRLTDTNETSKTLSYITHEREKKYAILQQYALEENGFRLKEDEISLFSQMFRENIRMSKAEKRDLEKIYYVLKKIISQADDMNLINKDEVCTVCKKMFSLRMENSEVWV